MPQEDFDNFDFNNFKKSNQEYFSMGYAKQQDQNLLEEDQIYNEFSHQDLNQSFFKNKQLAEIFEVKQNLPQNNFGNNFANNDNPTNYFNNFPNNFQNPEKPPEQNNFFFNFEQNNQNQNPVDYAQFFNNEAAFMPFKKESEVDNTKFFNNEGESAFHSIDIGFIIIFY